MILVEALRKADTMVEKSVGVVGEVRSIVAGKIAEIAEERVLAVTEVVEDISVGSWLAMLSTTVPASVVLIWMAAARTRSLGVPDASRVLIAVAIEAGSAANWS